LAKQIRFQAVQGNLKEFRIPKPSGFSGQNSSKIPIIIAIFWKILGALSGGFGYCFGK
jgi:hypothetical protein